MDAVTNNIQNLLLGLPGGNVAGHGTATGGGLLSAGVQEGQLPFQSTLWAEGIAPTSARALTFGADIAAGYHHATNVADVTGGADVTDLTGVAGIAGDQAPDNSLYGSLVSFDTLQNISDNQIASFPGTIAALGTTLGTAQPNSKDFTLTIGGADAGNGTEKLSHFIPLSELDPSSFGRDAGYLQGGLSDVQSLPADFFTGPNAADPIRLNDILLAQRQTAQAFVNTNLASRGTAAQVYAAQNGDAGHAPTAVQIINPVNGTSADITQATGSATSIGQQEIINDGILNAVQKQQTAVTPVKGQKTAPLTKDEAAMKAQMQTQAQVQAQVQAQAQAQASATTQAATNGQAATTNGLLMSYGIAAASPALNNGQMGMTLQNNVSRDNFVRTLKAIGIDSKADISGADLGKKMTLPIGNDSANTAGFSNASTGALPQQANQHGNLGQTAAFSWQGNSFADTLQSEQSGAYQTIASGLSGMRGDAAPSGFTATTPSQPSLSQQMMGQQAANQVALSINKTTGADGQSFKVNLKPAELGVVKVSLNFANDGKVQATILAERPETLDLLKQDSRSIEKALTEAGHKLDKDGIQYDLDQDQGQSAGKAWAESLQEDAHKEQQAVNAALNGKDGTAVPVGGEVEDIPLDDILPYVTVETGLDIRV